MNNKLFYKDPYIKTFETKVLKQLQDEKGNPYLILEDTAFYPTGGGQPNDVGTLNGIKVTNVEELDGEIRHYVERTLPISDEKVLGVIDWERRFDHMQQHTGQHILSATFEQLYGIETIGFHLGQNMVTIDLATSELTEEVARKAEKVANEIILENRTIKTKWVEYDELVNYPLRKMPSVSQNIRLVIIDEFDYNGCGGTHPKYTGEVGAINILFWERQRKNIRLYFVCGNRVITQLNQKQKLILELTRLLNSPEEEINGAVRNLLENVKTLDKKLLESNEKLLQYEAIELLNKSEIQDETVIVIEAFTDRPIQEIQKLARFIAQQDKQAIVFLLVEKDNRLQFVCTRGDIQKVNVKIIAQECLLLIDGKGGGNETFAQGGGPASLKKEIFIKQTINIISQQIESGKN